MNFLFFLQFSISLFIIICAKLDTETQFILKCWLEKLEKKLLRRVYSSFRLRQDLRIVIVFKLNRLNIVQ